VKTPRFVVLAVFAVLSSCATKNSSSRAEPAPAAEAEKSEALVGPPQVAWKDMTKEQRAKFMKAVVTPKMKELFVAFNAKDYANFNCKTCHGDGVKDRSFKMPNPALEDLPATPAGWGELQKEHPEILKFMGETVKPQMAALLGLEPFDPQNPKPGTFGCQNCHTTEKQ
jgi:hypothetical protein